MKKKFKLFSILLLASTFTYGQGCSDAGFCTLQPTRHVGDFISKKNEISIGLGYGAGFENVKVLNSTLQYGYNFNEKIGVQAKVTGLSANGSLGNNSGLSDLFLTTNYRLSTTNSYDFRFLAGLKIPFTNSKSKDSRGISLPLDYQSSLGTYDLIVGTTLVYDKKWDFSMAFQVPVSNKNENEFSPDYFENADKFVQTTNFERKSDGLIKVGYILKNENSRLIFRPNMLAIYHLGNDTYTDFFNNRTEIKGSNGLTLNAVLNTTLTFKDNSDLELTLAAPLKFREVRPDGLTRKFVIGLQYKIKF